MRHQASVLVTDPYRYEEIDLGGILDLDRTQIVEKNIRSQSEFLNVLSQNQFELIFFKLGLYMGEVELASQPGLKVIATPTTGLNHIDLEACYRSGIQIISLKGEVDFLSTVSSTAEHAWMLLLACSRSLKRLLSVTAGGGWYREGLNLYQLKGKTLGLIGYGRLGEMLADYGHAFGMKIVVTDPKLTSKPIENESITATTLEILLSSADYVIVVASFEGRTLLTKEKLDLMGHSTIFINVARGELVDGEALLKRVSAKTIGAVGLDVFKDDSSWADHIEDEKLRQHLDCENLIVTPHVGGFAKEAISAAGSHLVGLVKLVLER